MDDVYLEEIEENEYTKQDKLDMLTYSRVSVFFGIFFGIVLLTNLFLVNMQANNPITLGWGILSIIITVFHVVYIVWNIQEARRIANVSDLYASQSDDFESRIVFLIYFFSFLLFALFFLAYGIARDELKNYFLLQHQARQLQGYTAFLVQKSTWINSLAVLNILVLLHVIYTSYALTGTQYAIRYYIYASASGCIMISFFILNQFNLLQSIFKGSASVFTFKNWNDAIVRQFAIFSIPLLIIMFLGNHFRLKNLLLMVGSVLMVLVAVQTSAAGQTVREYKQISNYFDGRCNIELGDIDRQFIEQWRCSNKYQYQNQNECPQDTSNIATCLQNAHICPRNHVARVWESSIVRINTVPVFGCIDQRCCGGLNLLYTQPVLVYSMLITAWSILSFSMAVFAFLINSKEQGDPLDSTSTTFFFILGLLVLISGLSLLAFNKIEPVPRTPYSYNLNLNNHDHSLMFNEYTSTFMDHHAKSADALTAPQKGLFHSQQNEEHQVADEQLQQVVELDQTNQIDSIEEFKPEGSCQNFLSTAIPKQGNSKLKTFSNQVVPSVEVFNTLDFFVPTDEKVPEGTVNIGYIVCISAYKQGTNRYPTVFNLRQEFRTNMHLRAYQIDGYSCGKHIVQHKNPTNQGFRYQDDQSYTGVIGYKDAVLQFLSEYLEVCNGDPLTNAGTYNIMGIQIDLDTHDGTRFFSHNSDKSFENLSTINPTAPRGASVRENISVRYVQFTTLSESLNYQVMENAFIALDAHNLGQCQTDFDKTPMKQSNIKLASFVSTTNDLGQSHVVMIVRIETAPRTPTDPINRSSYVGNPEFPSNFALYGWRYVQAGVIRNIEFNCREFGLSYKNQILNGQIVISPLLTKDQVRIVLQWRDPTVDLDLNSSFGVPNDFLCQVSEFNPGCGNVRHSGEGQKSPDQNRVTTEVITIDKLGPYSYVFFISMFVNIEERNANKNFFGSPLQDSLPTITYYYYQGIGRDAIAVIITTDPTNFSACPNETDVCNQNTQDSNTVDVSLNVFCVNGGQTSLPLLYGRDGTREGKFGVYWDSQKYTTRFEQIVDKGAPLFPMNDVCREFNQPAFINS